MDFILLHKALLVCKQYFHCFIETLSIGHVLLPNFV